MGSFFEFILYVLLAAALLGVPVLCRAYLELVQGLAGIIIAIVLFISYESVIAGLPFALLWIIGSLAAISWRSREAAEEAVELHRLSYHDSDRRQADEQQYTAVLSYLNNKYSRDFVLLQREYEWSKRRHKYVAHPAGHPGHTFYVYEEDASFTGIPFSDSFVPGPEGG